MATQRSTTPDAAHGPDEAAVTAADAKALASTSPASASPAAAASPTSGAPPEPAAPPGPAGRARRRRRTAFVRTVQLAIVAAFLVGWQELPNVPWVADTFSFMNTFFISSPTLVAKELWNLVSGSEGAVRIWGPFLDTILTSLAGTAAALVIGAVGGIAVSNWGILESVTRPFLVVVNAVPKVAIIPIIILLVHSDRGAAGLTAFLSVFFLAFYNAAEGASSVPREMIHNAELLGASKLRVMLRVRAPYAVAWTLAALPNAIAFGLTATVTVEIISGGSGLGYQLLLGIDNSNATLLFAIVIIVSIVGVALVLGATALRRLLLPWWESSQDR